MPRYVYWFGDGEADGRGDQKELLGGKGANLAEMIHLGVPVPPGFTITTELCSLVDDDTKLPEALETQVTDALARIAKHSGLALGDPQNPLLVSVRSGAAASMPGMMDTILNLGLNDETVRGLAAHADDLRFAYDCYRRFVAMYGEVVMGVTAANEDEDSPFAALLAQKKAECGVEDDRLLDADALKSLVTAYKIEILRRCEVPFPENPQAQLWGAIRAVFRSWNTERAQIYRRAHGIGDNAGTAVNVQSMVFGNLGNDCATGVAFTRNPATGAPGLFGEYLINAQGEDVVAGIRTPDVISTLAKVLPNAYQELLEVAERLETHFGDMQDLEFTIQGGRLWLLQTRNAKRTGAAMVRVAVALVREGKIDRRTAVGRIDPEKLSEVLHPAISPDSNLPLLGKGLPASPGAAMGAIVFTASRAEEFADQNKAVILVRTDTSPEDIRGMQSAAGILTARGGMTSHAAVVARGMGKCCVTACSGLQVDTKNKRAAFGDQILQEGDVITLDGSTGEVFAGRATLAPAKTFAEFDELMEWVDEVRRLRVRTNADTAADAKTARAFGAEGIGLCRTEHMFFAPERLVAMREMIVAADSSARAQALDKMLPMQRDDFVALFEAMDGLPVTIRLLDPPLHEFLPHTDAEQSDLARDLGVEPDVIKAAVHRLAEHNPMLGHRGCRLAISHPEIYAVQTRAIAEATVIAMGRGIVVQPEIMIPFVATEAEIRELRLLVCNVFQAVLDQAQTECPFLVGTMIELPRACLVGDKIAAHADFFSFGTNDLTQTTFGLSRDDAGSFLPDYLAMGAFRQDPFAVLDREGVGALIRLAVERGRQVKTKLKIGICGEHGGESSSVEFCHVEGFDYVSCSPFRVPIARVAAARAALRGEARAK